MNSFDVFDTLLARRYITVDPVLDHIERITGIAGFKAARIGADTGGRSFDEIYQAMVDQGIIPQDRKAELMQQEIDLEISTAIPVRKNLDRVQHGDILISDMYLPAHVILRMVRAAGMDKQVTLYQSNGDKRNGSVWGKFKTIRPDIHLGDNKHSDCDSPNAAGMNGEWFHPATEMVEAENLIASHRLAHLSLLMREIRLGLNGPDVTELACSANLPLLFILCEWLHRIETRDIVFLGRDCFLLEKIFSTYYRTGYYLPFSRKVAFAQTEDATNYLKTHSPPNAILFDISSTGGTWEKVNLNVKVAIYSDKFFYTETRPQIGSNFTWLTTNSEIGDTNLVLEILNCADHGHLSRIDVQEGKLMQTHFDEPEMPASMVADIHAPILEAVRLHPHYKSSIRAELAALDDHTLRGLFKILLSRICLRTDILKNNPLFVDKENDYLKDIRP